MPGSEPINKPTDIQQEIAEDQAIMDRMNATRAFEKSRSVESRLRDLESRTELHDSRLKTLEQWHNQLIENRG